MAPGAPPLGLPPTQDICTVTTPDQAIGKSMGPRSEVEGGERAGAVPPRGAASGA